MNKYIDASSKVAKHTICCVHCGKGYKSRTYLDKHLILCEITHDRNKRKNANDSDEPEIIPSPKAMFKIITELTLKCNRLEEKIDDMSRWNARKKTQIDVVQWLSSRTRPEFPFDKLIDCVVIALSDVELLFNNNVHDTFGDIMMRTVYRQKNLPVVAFIHKPSVIYIYDKSTGVGGGGTWIEMTKENLVRFLNKFQCKLSKMMTEWKKIHRDEILSTDSLAITYDKSTSKLFGTDFNKDSIYSKFKSHIHSNLKIDINNTYEV